jgi:hypothetical protein
VGQCHLESTRNSAAPVFSPGHKQGKEYILPPFGHTLTQTIFLGWEADQGDPFHWELGKGIYSLRNLLLCLPEPMGNESRLQCGQVIRLKSIHDNDHFSRLKLEKCTNEVVSSIYRYHVRLTIVNGK